MLTRSGIDGPSANDETPNSTAHPQEHATGGSQQTSLQDNAIHSNERQSVNDELVVQKQSTLQPPLGDVLVSSIPSKNQEAPKMNMEQKCWSGNTE